MHGLGDAAGSAGMEHYRALAGELLGVYSASVRIGRSDAVDRENSFVMPLDQQIEVFAATVQNDPKLAGGFNAIGYSQGNLVIRGYIQRYNDPPVRRYVSMHGPHGGVSGFPSCNVSEPFCKYYAEFLGDLAYTRLAQKAIAPANYYRDPARVNAFIKGCTFLADLNQLSSFNSTYKQNMLSLEKVLLVKATEDEVVQPPVSAYFGYDVLAPDGSFEAVDGHTTPVYSNDTLGLSTLEKSGRLSYATTPGAHMHFSELEWRRFVMQTFSDDPVSAA
eukprot:PRCOL_00005424-RA